MKTNKEILEEISAARNYADRTILGYNTALNNYTSFHNMSMHELIKEAEEEEEKGIRWKHRKLKQRLLDYRQYCLDNYLLTTAQSNMVKVRSIYRYYEIEIQPLPYVSLKQATLPTPLSYNDIPTR